MSESWKEEWLPLVAMVGESFGGNEVEWGADPIEAGAVRRFLEPLEFDCPLHSDPEVAETLGYDNLVAPYSSLLSFAMPPLWSPGQAVFVSQERDAQPVGPAIRPPLPEQAPACSGYFATDIEMDYLRPVMVGEHLGKRGRKLVGCKLKETRVGRGAFVTFESELVNRQLEPVARMRTSLFFYNPSTANSE
ncbi:FAS1-like dehydratase domain-containing protein [Pseudomonas sp. OTU5201]|uniref:FAS1-like dehydratase domain-containing protein n=1 Tax=Pseudomonas sp. OTU5201 TaxID=3043850 RepID=UPI00313BDE9C